MNIPKPQLNPYLCKKASKENLCVAGGIVVEYMDGAFSAASIWKNCLAVIFGDTGKGNCFPGCISDIFERFNEKCDVNPVIIIAERPCL